MTTGAGALFPYVGPIRRLISQAEKKMSDARYNVLTWDSVADQYTEQEGMDNPCLNVDVTGLRRALRELKCFGYSCHRFRDEDGRYHSDWAVLVERVDDPVIDAMVFDNQS